MKPWYRQRTTLTGIASLVTGVFLSCKGNWNDGLELVAIGLASIFGRQSVNQIARDQSGINSNNQ